MYIGHGSRVEQGNKQFLQFIEQVKPAFPVLQREAYIELARPTIQEAIDDIVAEGATKLAVVPVLLLTAYHATHDIPAELTKARERHPRLEITYGRPFGIEADVIDVALKRLQDAGLPRLEKERKNDTTVLVVGRGSSDGNQPSDVAKIARLIYEKMACDNVEIAFLAATTPTLEQGLVKCERLQTKTVYVLPYLLFTGVLMEELRAAISERESSTQFVLCDFLGFDHDLKSVLIRRAKEACAAERFA